jgi:predicted ATP-dependent endonuclease of OLD family
MTDRKFDVILNVMNLEGTQQELPNILLELVTSREDIPNEMPLKFSGAGIAEALYLSALLAGSTGQVILLDEPALNLHPTMQTMLLNELQALAHQPAVKRSQFIINTHTPTLVPPDAIDRVSRFTLQGGHTIRRALKTPQKEQNDKLKIEQINQNDLIKLKRLLRGDLAARAFLFSRAVLLVEGETELGALPIWCPYLVHQDIALYALGGKGAFIAPLRLIKTFTIPWAILGDGEVLWDRAEQKRHQNPHVHIDNILDICSQPLPPIL